MRVTWTDLKQGMSSNRNRPTSQGLDITPELASFNLAQR